ncbi:MAG: DUF5343 domain-containing protein [Dehalococcoidales bacterium]|nr:DUF5343 domain-containing protein [Dehalococcoidales bacterium]
MVIDRGRKRLPPYISYRTFQNFVDRLQQGVPARIDRSYWSDNLASSTGTQLMGALRFLGLIDNAGAPTGRLRSLVSARDEKRTEVLRQITDDSFDFLLRSPIDATSATYSQFDEIFHRTFELTDDVCHKCLKFFAALASEAGIPLSPFITERLRPARTGSTKAIAKKKAARTSRNLLIPPLSSGLTDSLIAKFPTFDPTWSDEVKLKWFEAFDELLRRDASRSKK